MAFQKVPAGNGLKWITDAVNLILKNPLPFVLMGLVFAVIGLVPFLGALALLVLGPALNGGIIFAAREEEAGRKADFQQLFQAFREEGKLVKMLILCLPMVAALVVVLVLGAIAFGGALLGAGLASNSSSAGSAFGAGLGLGMLLLVLVGLAIGVVCYALTFFAVPRVMLESTDPVPAMKDSAQACLANIGAVLLYAVLVLVAFVLVSMVLALIPILGQLIVTTALVPFAAVASYLAYSDVYVRQHDITQELPPTPPSIPG
jgi:uncharacterized membrane protein